MNTPALPGPDSAPGREMIGVEHVTQHLITADTIIVPASSAIVDRWQDELGPLASAAGMNTKFETIGDELGLEPALVSVALGTDAVDEQHPRRPWHYGGDWFRLRLPRYGTQTSHPDDAGELVGLCQPETVIGLACGHFGLEDPTSRAVPQPPAGERLRAMHQRTARTAISSTIAFDSVADLQHWLDRTASAAVAKLVPGATILVESAIRNPASDNGATAPALVVARPRSRCSLCGRPRRSRTTHAAAWDCTRCNMRNQPEPIAAARFEGRTDIASHQAQPVTAPNLATLEAITLLGAEAHSAREHTLAAAQAWDLAATIARQLAHLAAAEAITDGADRIARWVHLVEADSIDNAPDMYRDCRWAGLDVTAPDRPIAPIVGWDAQLGELSVAHTAPTPSRMQPHVPAVTRISPATAQHPDTLVARAETAAAALRDQLRPELGGSTVPVIFDSHCAVGLHCHVTEPDAQHLDRITERATAQRHSRTRSL